MMNPDRLLIVSMHHRRSLFFEDTMRNFYNAGYTKQVIIETGGKKWGEYQGPSTRYIDAGETSYDKGMFFLKKILEVEQYPDNFDHILFLDNDLFIQGIDEFQKYYKEYTDGDYDLVCHLVSIQQQIKYEFENKAITEIKEITFDDLDNDTSGLTPHWQTTYMFLSKKLWDKLSFEEVCHHRKLMRAAYKIDAKLGAHTANYITHLTTYGDEWFHVGALIKFYYEIEKHLRTGNPYTFDQGSKENMFRAGYFLRQEELYGKEIYPESIYIGIEYLYEYMGGRKRIKHEWNVAIRGTVMKDWEKIND